MSWLAGHIALSAFARSRSVRSRRPQSRRMMWAKMLPCTSAAQRLLSATVTRCCVSAHKPQGFRDVRVCFDGRQAPRLGTNAPIWSSSDQAQIMTRAGGRGQAASRTVFSQRSWTRRGVRLTRVEGCLASLLPSRMHIGYRYLDRQLRFP